MFMGTVHALYADTDTRMLASIARTTCWPVVTFADLQDILCVLSGAHACRRVGRRQEHVSGCTA